jgi:lysophospholipase L1-like esterase
MFDVICSARSLAQLVLAIALGAPVFAFAQKAASLPEEVEWTWEVRPALADPHLPNVLLLGDSISRAYFPEVTKDLVGTANVYLMASSTSVGDQRLPLQIAEFAKLENVSFQVVHFNNGMHGWGYTEEQYQAAFPDFLKAVRSIAAKAAPLIWATTTPVRDDARDGATNPRIDARNAAAAGIVRSAGIAIDDQHALMLNHGDLHEDSVHFNDAGAKLQGDQVAETIRAALGRRMR